MGNSAPSSLSVIEPWYWLYHKGSLVSRFGDSESKRHITTKWRYYQERMVRLKWTFFPVFLLYAAANFGASDQDTRDTPVLTVCQALRDSARYGGQPVIVVGRSVSTGEGSWLDESCGMDLVIEVRKYPTSISTSYVVWQFAPPPQRPKGFMWDKGLLRRRLADVQKTTRLEGDANWFAVYGRLETAPTRKIALGNGQFAMTSGYGHLGSAPAQMVARSDCWLILK